MLQVFSRLWAVNVKISILKKHTFVFASTSLTSSDCSMMMKVGVLFDCNFITVAGIVMKFRRPLHITWVYLHCTFEWNQII